MKNIRKSKAGDEKGFDFCMRKRSDGWRKAYVPVFLKDPSNNQVVSEISGVTGQATYCSARMENN